LWRLLERIWTQTFPESSFEATFGGRLALGSCVLFAVHPLHVEVVPAIARRAEMIVAVCLFACLLAVWWRLRGGGAAATIVALGACLLGLGAKEAGFAIPAHAVVFGFCFSPGGTLRERVRNSLRATAPLIVAAVAFLAIRSLVLGNVGGYRMAGYGLVRRLELSALHHLLGLGLPGLSNLWGLMNEWFSEHPALVVVVVFGLVALVVQALRVVGLKGPEARAAAFFAGGIGLIAAVHLPVVMVPRYLYVSAAWASSLLVWITARGLLIGEENRASRWTIRGVGALAAVVVASLIVTSPLTYRGPVDEWRVAGEVGAAARSDTDRLVELLPDGQTLFCVGFPYLVRTEHALPISPVLLEHSLQGWLDLRFPGRGHRVVGTSYLELDLRGWPDRSGTLPVRVGIEGKVDGTIHHRVLAAGQVTRFPWQRIYGAQYEGRLYRIEGQQRGGEVKIRILEQGWNLDPVFMVYLVDRVESRSGRGWSLETG
jgi:hypothetical protein